VPFDWIVVKSITTCWSSVAFNANQSRSSTEEMSPRIVVPGSTDWACDRFGLGSTSVDWASAPPATTLASTAPTSTTATAHPGEMSAFMILRCP
jgi:hypothetical protein